MVSYNYEIAKTVTSEAEKERILCIFLNTDNGVVDWEKATKDFGSASVDSMKVSLRNMYKKIEKAGGKLADDGTATQTPTTPNPATPASGKKRKSKGELTADGDDDDATIETPKPKKKGGRPKKNATPKSTADEVMEDGDGEAVKKENDDDLI